MRSFASAVALVLLASILDAGAEAQQPRARESHVEVYGDDPCPRSSEDEIVICARRPEEERYRIPAPLRESRRRPEGSWSSHAAELEEVQRDTRPDSCSVVGSWGQSGCTAQMFRQWRADRRERARERAREPD